MSRLSSRIPGGLSNPAGLADAADASAEYDRAWFAVGPRRHPCMANAHPGTAYLSSPQATEGRMHRRQCALPLHLGQILLNTCVHALRRASIYLLLGCQSPFARASVGGASLAT